jgi:hypothetical protein
MVGCCCHHAHADDCCARIPLSNADAAPDSQYPCGHNHDQQHGQNDCHGIKCSFLRTLSVTASKSLLQLCQITVALPTGTVSALPGASVEQHSISTGRLLWPVRLHLANQVLII